VSSPGIAAVDDAGAQLRGRALVLGCGVFLSIGGPLIRLLDGASEWQFMFWRALALTATLLVIVAWRAPDGVVAAIRSTGVAGLVGGLCLGTAFVGFVFSMTHTTVANTLFLLSAGPFLSAMLARVVLGEQVSRTTWIAMAGAGAGVGLMVGEGIREGDLFGDLTALGAAFCFACFSVALRTGGRRSRRGGGPVDMLPTVCIAGVWSGVTSAAMIVVAGHGFAVSVPDLGLSFLYGTVSMGGGLLLFTLGARHLQAAELNLLSLSEVVLGPLWVWLAFRETPSAATLAGGAILLGALVYQATGGVVRRRRPPIAA